ncbi:MAG: diaminopimelate epimerase [Flavobacteriaceae bacterium]|nr:diaminopimelate epimerase [Flavobacteriaceae bacterium]
MEHTFYKYQGTGNDFVMIDNRQLTFDKNDTKRISMLCNRRFGVGGDGLILLEHHLKYDFKMVYFNADGNESSMCGNGGRCLVAFAKQLGLIRSKAVFEAIDGMHEAVINDNEVKLQMQNVTNIQRLEAGSFLDTGSPHYVTFNEQLENLDVKTVGAAIRYNENFKVKGTNVNFVKPNASGSFDVRTYERGVEDETLSCGTGVTAVALAMHNSGETDAELITLHTKGGTLQVAFETSNEGYKNIWLIGEANFVFKGIISW